MKKVSNKFYSVALSALTFLSVSVLMSSAAQAATIINDTFSDGATRPVVKGGNLDTGDATTPGVNGNWHAADTSNWTHGPGTFSLYNTGSGTGTATEGGVALLVDMATFSNPGDNALRLSFDINAADPDDNLYVHLWGFVSNGDPGEASANFANRNSTNGMWESTEGDLTPGAAGPFDDYNLGGVNGAFTGNSGVLSDAAVTGLAGVAGSYTYSFNLSSFTTAPNTVGEYDYLVLGFQRDINAGTTAAFQIDNVLLESFTAPTPEPSSLGLILLGAALLSRTRKGLK